MATAQSHGNQISMENWSSPFWSPSLLGISMGSQASAPFSPSLMSPLECWAGLLR